MYARTTPAVFSGRSVSDCAFSLWARALSSQVNISFETMSVSSPTLREKSCRLFEDGRANLVEVIARHDVAHLRVHPVPQVGVGREKVASSTDSFNHESRLSVAGCQLSERLR